jgi:ribonuclease HII
MILGIDEVGRGAWAGPLVVAAVSLGGETIDGLTDSKLLSKKKRVCYAREIKQRARHIGIGWVSARDLDRIGLSEALRLATRRAVEQAYDSDIDQIILDGTVNFLKDSKWESLVTTMAKADLSVPSVSAASVIAKVARDDYMALCDNVFPGYGFRGHVGYGAAKHREALESLGVLPIHRVSFAPIAALIQQPKPTYKNSHVTKNVQIVGRKGPAKETMTVIGKRAEDEAANYLKRHGYTIVERNWKTRWCEIDIVATKDKVVHFVEVKYRGKADQGGGIAAITQSKLRQMRFAAELWLTRAPDVDAVMSVIELHGETPEVSAFLERVD